MSRLEGLEACGWPPLLEPEPEGPDEWHPSELDGGLGLDFDQVLDYHGAEESPWWATVSEEEVF